MQFKRPVNTKKTGASVKVNSFQFLRAGRLVLSVKASELVNGLELPPDVLARVKGDPLTADELAAWKLWKTKHDRADLIEANIARFKTAVLSVADTVTDATNALAYNLVALTPAEGQAIWESMDELGRELKRVGLHREPRPRGRPKKAIYVDDDENTIADLPDFRPKITSSIWTGQSIRGASKPKGGKE
ncbi:MAG: hypothetical protein ACXWC4_03365 [Telluria sp.]